jgi:Spy/CpxP family protein refolding chaperone
MKNVIASLFALFLIIGATQAQQGHQRQQPKQKQLALFNQLNLTPAQKGQIQTIRQQQKQEMKQLNKNDKMTVGEYKIKRKEIQQKYRTQFQSVLTPQQSARLAKMRSVQHNNLAANRLRERLNRRFDQKQKLAKELNLTEDQKLRMASLRQDFKSKARVIRTDKSLTQEQKKSRIQELTKAQKEQMKTVLTQDQLQKVESHLKQQKKNDVK